ncbi:hypothetical protein QBC37DRAFT_406433, partial [Rhypophila decipiens]
PKRATRLDLKIQSSKWNRPGFFRLAGPHATTTLSKIANLKLVLQTLSSKGWKNAVHDNELTANTNNAEHKRNLPSEAERAVPPPSTKKAKLPLAAEMPPPTTLEEAIKIIDMFKTEQAALVKHISKTDTNILNAPPNIKALMRQGEEGVSVVVTAIHRNMEREAQELEEKMEAAGFKRGAVTSDDFSEAMFPYIAEISNLIDGNNGDELTRLRAGYELLFSLKDCSQRDPGEYV